MVSLDHERLFGHIDEYYHSSFEGWKQSYAIFNQVQQFTSHSATYHQLFPLLEHRGFHTTLLNDDPAWISTELEAGAAHTLLLYNHYGTHPLWDLCALASRMLAIDLYREWAGTLPINIKWLLHRTTTANVSAPLHSIVKEHSQHLQADGCLCDELRSPEESTLFSIGDDTPVLFLGCKGLLGIELASQVTTTPISSRYGSIVPDAAWRLLWALNSLKNAREEIMIDGFYDTIAPIEDDAAAALYTLPDTAPVLAEQWGISDLLPGLCGLQMHYAHLLTPSCTINFIAGGDETSAQIPAQARAQIEFSLVPGQKPDDILASLQHHLHEHGFSDIHVQQRSSCPPAYTQPSHPFVQLVSSATTQVWEQAPLMLPIMPSSHPLAPLQQRANMPLLITSTGSSHLQWDHPSMTALLKQKLKQTALIIHRLGTMA